MDYKLMKPGMKVKRNRENFTDNVIKHGQIYTIQDIPKNPNSVKLVELEGREWSAGFFIPVNEDTNTDKETDKLFDFILI